MEKHIHDQESKHERRRGRNLAILAATGVAAITSLVGCGQQAQAEKEKVDSIPIACNDRFGQREAPEIGDEVIFSVNSFRTVGLGVSREKGSYKIGRIINGSNKKDDIGLGLYDERTINIHGFEFTIASGEESGIVKVVAKCPKDLQFKTPMPTVSPRPNL